MAISYNEYRKKYNDNLNEYQNKYNEAKKSNEITSFNINDAEYNFNVQKNKLTNAQKEYSQALNNEYKKLEVFKQPTLNTEIKFPTTKPANNNNLKFSLVDDEKLKQAQSNVKDLKDTVDKEYNDFKLARYYKTLNDVENEKTTLWDKTGGVIIRGLEDLASSLGTEKYKYKDENGNTIYLPNYSALKQQKVSQDYNTNVGKFLGDVGYNTTKILGSVGLDVIAPGTGSILYWQDMAVDNYKNAINQGYDSPQAALYSLTNTGFEYLTGKLLGGATGKLTGGSARELDKAASNFINKFTGNATVSRILGTAFSEGTEEFIQEYLDNISRILILGDNINILDPEILGDALYSAAVGAASGGIAESASSSDITRNIKLYETFKEQLEQRKANTTDKAAINEYDKIIDSINNYIEKPFSINEKTTQNIENETANVADTTLSRLQEFRKQQEQTKAQLLNQQEQQRQQQMLEETNRRLNTLEQQGTRILEESETQREAMIENFKQYLEENNITNPTQEDINDSITDLLSYDNDLDFADTAKAEQLYNKYVKEYMQENGIPFNNGNNEYRGSHQIENAKRLVDLNIDDIQKRVEDLNGYLTKQDEVDLRKLHKIFNHPEEDIKIYRASPVNELNNGDWITTDKAYAKNVAQQNGGKVYEYTVKPSQLYYPDNIRDLPSLHRLSSFQYVEGQPAIPTASNFNQLPKQNKGNIPIQKELYKKYPSARAMFDAYNSNYDGIVNIDSNIEELNNVDFKNIEIDNAKELAGDIFDKYYNTNGKPITFVNNGNKIVVSHDGIDESVEKIYYNNKQHKLLEVHMAVFSDLGDIIENAKLISQREETKNRIKYNTWNYYYDGIKYKNKEYSIIFDVVSMDSGENHYRLQRLEQKKQADYDGVASNNTRNLPPNSQPVSMNNDTTKDQKSQISLPTHNMQQNEESISTKDKISMPMVKDDDVIKVASEKIAKQINDTGGFDLKQRSWVETATESDVLKDKVYIDDLEPGKISYVVQSNKKSLDSANRRLETYGYEKTLNYVNEIMQSDKLPSASDVALMQRMIQEASKRGDYETVQNLIMDTAIVGTDLGQATQALSIIQRLTPEGQLKMYTKLVQRAKARGEKSFDGVEITPEMVEEILGAYNKNGTYDQEDLNNRVEKFKQDLANQMKSTKAEKIDAWRYLAMLGNPKTHLRNIFSNIAMKGTIKVKNAMARTLETVLPVKDRTKTWKPASKEIKDYARKTTQEMKGIITGENKYNEKSALEANKQIFKTKLLEKSTKGNGNLLEWEDWKFSSSAFRTTLQEYLTAKGINTLEDIKNNPELVEKAKLYAVEQAEIATFRQYSKLASEINRIERNNKFAKYPLKAVIPFKKTPINVAKAGVKYSPLGLIKSISYDAYQLKQGNIEASQFIDNLSQGLTGTSLTLLGYALAKAGYLTGSGGDDKDDKYDKQLGNTGYSLNIGGNSYSISWLSPVAMPLLVGSNAYEKLEEGEGWNPDIVANTLAETLDPLSEMSFVSSLTDVLTSYNTGSAQMIKDIGTTAGQSYVMQFFPTLFSQLAATTDDKKRSTKVSNNSNFKIGEETLRKIMYKIPGLRQQLEVATDVWGNEKEQSSNIIERAFESFIAPYSKTKDISTDLDKEIKRVYNETGENGVIPGIPYAYTKYNGETYKMSANEYTEFKKTYGQTANSTLNSLIHSSSYKNASDEEQAKMIKNVYDYARAKANQEYFDSNDIDYENQILNKIDTLKQNYGISASTYYANKNEYDYAYQNPEKYSVIKQIASYDKYTTYKNKITQIRNNTTNDKQETIKYINSLNMNVAQKAMFIKQYYKSFKQYDKEIVNYINKQKLTSKEKTQILEQLGFTIKDGRVYY